jgi:general secretion pathway protein G
MKRQTPCSCRRSEILASRRGFTLTELLIVMAILVLLVSLIGPRLLGSKQKADINAVKTQIGMFQSALERYAVDMNKFPSTEQGLKALVSKPGVDGGAESSDSDSADSSAEPSTDDSADSDGGDGNDSGSSASSWDGPYLNTETLPKDPWGNSFVYEYPATHNKMNVPDIWSFGPDGQEGTEDDIVSWTGKGRNDGESGESNSSTDSTDSTGGAE